METGVKTSSEPGLKTGNRHLFFGLGFAVAAVIAWNIASDTYRKTVAVVISGDYRYNVSLETVTRHEALFPMESMEQWLGPTQAGDAYAAQARYRQAYAIALLCGFFAVFWVGMHLDVLRADRAGGE
jgi:hypothetical protein